MAGIDARVRRELEAILGAAVDFGAATAHAYSVDNSRLRRLPDGVAFPRTAEQVRRLVGVAFREGVPVVARGRGTATTGAALAERGGLVVTTERLGGEISVDAPGRLATVPAGTLNGELQAHAARDGLFWPPDPSSMAYSTVGGNIATAAAGPRHFGHGGTRGGVRRLRVVTGTGELVTLGGLTEKRAVGYDLASLMVGSEGTLGVIVEATLALRPIAAGSAGVAAEFPSLADCLGALARLTALDEPPVAVEFLDGGALDLVRGRHPGLVGAGAQALLLAAVEGDRPGALAARALECCAGAAASRRTGDMAELWALRRALSPLLRDASPHKVSEDVAVPPPRLGEFLEGMAAIAREERTRNVNFGHIADGNLHVNLLADPSDPDAPGRARRALERALDLAVSLGGSISGEHGIGITRREHIAKELPGETLRLMAGIKSVFDPKGIMNPGKILPDGPANDPAAARPP